MAHEPHDGGAPGEAGSEEPLRVAMAAGGTGGHLTPALAVAEELERRRRAEFLVFGSRRPTERSLRRIVPYPVTEIDVAALAGVGWIRGLGRLARLPAVAWSCRRRLKGFAPHLLLAGGGYVSGPVAVAARSLGIPILALEQNAVPGRTTRWLRPLVEAFAVSFPSTAKALGSRAIVTGNPVRSSVRRAAEDRRSADGEVDPEGECRLLVLGGSQGARGLNDLVEDALPDLAAGEPRLTVRHQTGDDDVDRMRRAYADAGIDGRVEPFIVDIADAYRGADLVVARAGASTLAEIACCGLASILVPFPHAADRHQHANARALVEAGAARLVDEGAGAAALAETILELAGRPDLRHHMGERARAVGGVDAASEVATLALSLVAERSSTISKDGPTSHCPAVEA